MPADSPKHDQISSWAKPFVRRLAAPFRRLSETPESRAQWLQSAITSATAAWSHAAPAAPPSSSSRSFAAAETPDWVASWPTVAGEINESLSRQWSTMMHRSRLLARNNEWAQRYLIHLEDNVLGSAGIRLQMRVTKATRPGEQDAALNAALETEWARFGARGTCEVSHCHTWREVEKLALMSLAKDGELLYRIRRGTGPFGVQLQLLPATLLDVTLNREHQGRRIRLGVEIDDDGVPVAYWLQAARSGDSSVGVTSVGRHVRVPADEIRHRFVVEEIGQLRGIPWLAVGARRLWMAQKFEEAASVASTNSAQRLGFFVSPTGEAPPGFADRIISSVLETAKAAGKVLTPDEIAQLTASAEKFTTTVPGQFDVIPQGYDVRKYDSDWPNVSAGEFVKSQIRGWSAARGASYVSIGNDLADVNYSSARVGILDEREHYKVLQERLVSWLHEDVFAAWLPYAVLRHPSLRASRIDAYRAAATWRPRRWQGIDPVKEAEANRMDLSLGLTSRTRLILERGEDPEQIAAERAEDDRLFGPLPETPPAALPSPPDEAGQKDSPPGKPDRHQRGNFSPSLLKRTAS